MQIIQGKLGIYGANRLLFHTTGFTSAKLMFGMNYTVSLDILYGANRDIADHTLAAEYVKMLQSLHGIAHSSMSARQCTFASHYDRKVLGSELDVSQLVYVYQPRNKVWILCQWLTRDKLKSVKKEKDDGKERKVDECV